MTDSEHANKGILITTSTFTAPALKFAENKPLELIDGTKFNQLLSKYNIAVSYNGTLSFENERIEELTEQLNNNPKNIFALKELADIYLIQEDYNKAVELYEILLASKPSVETEKLKNAYEYGVLNYGVALAKLKRYDDALKFFREKGGVCVLIEAYLTHYLGLYEIATSIYQKLKLAGLNRDEFLEKAYLQMQMDSPGLPVFITKNGTEEGSSISLDTAHQKAAQEGRKDLYYPLVMECLDVNREFDRIWRELKAGAESNQIFSDSDNTQNFAQDIVLLENRCLAVITKGKDVLNIATTNTLQKRYKEEFSRLIILVEIVYDSVSKYLQHIVTYRDLNENNVEEFKNEFFTIIKNGYAAFKSRISEYEERNLSVKVKDLPDSQRLSGLDI